jgi:hypothetical protein
MNMCDDHNNVLKLKDNKQQVKQIEVGLYQGVGAVGASPLSLHRCLKRSRCSEREQWYHVFLHA